jgi:hypothetical protein
MWKNKMRKVVNFKGASQLKILKHHLHPQLPQRQEIVGEILTTKKGGVEGIEGKHKTQHNF